MLKYGMRFVLVVRGDPSFISFRLAGNRPVLFSMSHSSDVCVLLSGRYTGVCPGTFTVCVDWFCWFFDV